MKKISIFIAVLIIGLFISCQKKADENNDMADNRIGTFSNDTASLIVNSIEDSVTGEAIDFQLEYTTDKNSGTMFGEAGFIDIDTYKFVYDSIGIEHNIEMKFEDEKWNIKYSAVNPENKELFDFTGIYLKKAEKLKQY